MRPTHTWRALAMTAGVVSGAAVAVPAPALATVAAPAIASAFAPNVVGVGDTTTLAFTITNPNASNSLSGIAFTDTLPTGLVIDNPNGENGTCGTNGVVTATTGTATIGLTGGSLNAAANCVVSVNVTSNTPGKYSNSTGDVSSTEGGSSTSGDTEALTVAGNPTISVSAPTNNAKYTLAQKVIASFTCAEGTYGPGLTDCSAFDDQGNTINNGSALDTSFAGTHEVTISATSADGLVASQEVDYTVLPDNQFTVSAATGHKDGDVTFAVKVPGAGKLVVSEQGSATHSGKIAFGTWSEKVGGAKTVRVTVKPGKGALKLLKTLKKQEKSKKSKPAQHPPTVTVSVTIAYTPTGGRKNTTTIKGIKIPS